MTPDQEVRKEREWKRCPKCGGNGYDHQQTELSTCAECKGDGGSYQDPPLAQPAPAEEQSASPNSGAVPALPVGFTLAPGFDPNGVPSSNWGLIAVLWEGRWKVGYVATPTDTYALHWEFPDAEKWTASARPEPAQDGFRTCEFCGCRTNAKARACCTAEGNCPGVDEKTPLVTADFARAIERELAAKDARIAELESVIKNHK